MRTNKANGFLLSDLLTILLVLMALGAVAVVLLGEFHVASQRDRMNRELDALNKAYVSHLSSGGKIRGEASAREVVATLNYLPLYNQDLYSRRVGAQTFDLAHVPGQGFFYHIRFKGGVTPVDTLPSTRAKALDMLEALHTMEWTVEEHRARLADLNSAYNMGLLSDTDMSEIGLIRNEDAWTTKEARQTALVEDAMEQLSFGVDWSLWDMPTKTAYANAHPEQAVQLAGAQALNLIDPQVLSGDLVYGYVKIGGSWEEPVFLSSNLDPGYTLPNNGATSPQATLYVYLQPYDMPVFPPKYIGYLASEQVLRWEGPAYYWRAVLPEAKNHKLSIATGEVQGLRDRVTIVTGVSNGEQDNNPWSGKYGRIVPNKWQRLIISMTPPSQENMD